MVDVTLSFYANHLQYIVTTCSYVSPSLFRIKYLDERTAPSLSALPAGGAQPLLQVEVRTGRRPGVQPPGPGAGVRQGGAGARSRRGGGDWGGGDQGEGGGRGPGGQEMGVPGGSDQAGDVVGHSGGVTPGQEDPRLQGHQTHPASSGEPQVQAAKDELGMGGHCGGQD